MDIQILSKQTEVVKWKWWSKFNVASLQVSDQNNVSDIYRYTDPTKGSQRSIRILAALEILIYHS